MTQKDRVPSTALEAKSDAPTCAAGALAGNPLTRGGGSTSDVPFTGVTDDQFAVSLESRGSCAVLAVAGELDLSTIGSLRTALVPLVADGDSDVVIDLSGLRFIDASGLGVLIRAQRRLRVRHRSLALVCQDGPVPRLLGLTGLRHVLRAFDTVDDACLALSRAQAPG